MERDLSAQKGDGNQQETENEIFILKHSARCVSSEADVRRHPCCYISPWYDLTQDLFNHVAEIISAKMPRTIAIINQATENIHCNGRLTEDQFV